MAMGSHNEWTEVHYGRRGRERRERPLYRDWGGERSRGTGSARSSSGWRRTRFFSPNRPAPRPWTGRRPGPRPRFYADSNRQRPQAPVRTQDPPRNNDPAVRREAASPELGRLIRQLYAVIKRVHHLQNVAPKPDKQEPRMIAKMVEILSTMITPAYPTQAVGELIVANAKNWGQITLQILAEHYEEGLEDHLKELKGSLPPDWKVAFEVASRWARKKFPRITRDVIDHAEAMIAAQVDSGGPAQTATSRQGDTTDTTSRQVGSAQTVSRQEGSTQTTSRLEILARTTPPQAVVVQSGTLAQVPAQTDGRRLATMTSVATMTDQVDQESEWFRAPREEEAPKKRRTTAVVPRLDSPPLLQEEEDLRAPVLSDSMQALADEFDRLEEEELRQEAEARAIAEARCQPARPSQPTPTSIRRVEVEFLRTDEDEEDMEEEVLYDVSRDGFGDIELPRFRATIHPNTSRKNVEWKFVAKKKWLVLGDSNMRYLPEFSYPDLQVEGFPGASFRNAEFVVSKARAVPGVVVEKVVLSFGLNGRANRPRETTIKSLQAAVRATKIAFPYAEVLIPLVNFSEALPADEQENLRVLNEYIQKNQPFIPLLPDEEFETRDDFIHWTEETGWAMLDHWITQLNLSTP